MEPLMILLDVDMNVIVIIALIISVLVTVIITAIIVIRALTERSKYTEKLLALAENIRKEIEPSMKELGYSYIYSWNSAERKIPELVFYKRYDDHSASVKFKLFDRSSFGVRVYNEKGDIWVASNYIVKADLKEDVEKAEESLTSRFLETLKDSV